MAIYANDVERAVMMAGNAFAKLNLCHIRWSWPSRSFGTKNVDVIQLYQGLEEKKKAAHA